MAGSRRVGWAALLVLLALAAPDAGAKGSVRKLQQEFREAIDRSVPAAVVCVAADVPPEQAGLGSSGVIVTESGYVLSDGDVGVVVKRAGGGRAARTYQDDVEVRLPDLEEGGFRAYRATVVRRVRSVDSTLLKIEDPPTGGFHRFLVPGSSSHLQVGDYNFVTGNAFGASREALPATTAGVVASLTRLPAHDAGGAFEYLYTSAAVNPGVNGGPVVDVRGTFIGTVSTFMTPEAGQPYQFLGKVVPIDRIRAAFSDLDEAGAVFGQPAPRPAKAPEAAALETVFRYAAGRAYPAVVSLEVSRSTPLSAVIPGPRNSTIPVPRFLGPFSGILVDEEGWVVTSLANLTNVATLIYQGWRAPPAAQVETGLRAITNVRAHLADGRDADAKVVAHDARLGLALLKLDLSAGGATRPAGAALEAAPPDVFVEGSFAVAVGNPFGKARNPDPLLAVGVLSKYHVEATGGPWRGHWQTDAAATDANRGGALVDLRGRVIGMLQIWSAPLFGRNSGIGFVVPWERIQAALPFLKEGRGRGFLGVVWKPGMEAATIAQVVPKSPAATAGLQAGDTIVGMGDRDTPTKEEVADEFAVRWAGEELRLTVLRGRKELTFDLVLGARPKRP